MTSLSIAFLYLLVMMNLIRDWNRERLVLLSADLGLTS